MKSLVVPSLLTSFYDVPCMHSFEDTRPHFGKLNCLLPANVTHRQLILLKVCVFVRFLREQVCCFLRGQVCCSLFGKVCRIWTEVSCEQMTTKIPRLLHCWCK
jgi:hypothetical protein